MNTIPRRENWHPMTMAIVEAMSRDTKATASGAVQDGCPDAAELHTRGGRDLRRAVGGVDSMTPAEFRAARKALSLTQVEFGAWLRVAKDTVSRMERGALPISDQTALLVQVYASGWRDGSFALCNAEMTEDESHD